MLLCNHPKARHRAHVAGHARDVQAARPSMRAGREQHACAEHPSGAPPGQGPGHTAPATNKRQGQYQEPAAEAWSLPLTLGMRVMPPTISTSWMSAGCTPASFMQLWQGCTVRSSRSLTRASNLALQACVCGWVAESGAI